MKYNAVLLSTCGEAKGIYISDFDSFLAGALENEEFIHKAYIEENFYAEKAFCYYLKPSVKADLSGAVVYEKIIARDDMLFGALEFETIICGRNEAGADAPLAEEDAEKIVSLLNNKKGAGYGIVWK